MPTATDSTVVAQPYSTEGNSGRKLVRLDNGWIIASAKNTGNIYFYVSKDNGQSFSQLCYVTDSYFVSGQDYSIVNKGNYIYLIYGISTQVQFKYFNAETITNININTGTTYLESVAQNAIGSVSLAINEAKTELHATWASKNATYSSSFNIRYAKGAINVDTTVTWGAVEQATIFNSTTQPNAFVNPSIIIDKNNIPVILSQSSIYVVSSNDLGSGGSILAIKKDRTLSYTGSLINSGWSMNNASGLTNISYVQSSPSAIFVPQSINGLTNGRIWVAWHGMDSTDTGIDNIRVSYSDDLGVTWSTMQKLTNGNNYNQSFASITANRNNEIFILFQGCTNFNTNTDYRIKQIKNTSGTWGSIVEKTLPFSQNPSTLFDLSFAITDPLFIYKDTTGSKVSFYGAWTTVSVSPSPSDIGIKSSITNLLTYAVTTDVTTFQSIEKINGVTVGTKNLTSGQNTTVSVTQTQWDAVRYGKYSNSTAGRNTLTIDVLGNTYSYTFDKTLRSDDDVLSIAKSVKDEKETYIPSVKKVLSDAINLQGGTTSPTDTFVKMSQSITSISNSKTGTMTATNTKNFPLNTGSNQSCFYISLDLSVLGFTPSFVFAQPSSLGSNVMTMYKTPYIQYNNTTNYAQYRGIGFSNEYLREVKEGNILYIPVASSAEYVWSAFK